MANSNLQLYFIYLTLLLYLAITEDNSEPLHAAATKVVLSVAKVLLPSVHHHHPAHDQRHQRHNKGGHGSKPKTFSSHIGDNTWAGKLLL